MAAPNQEPFGSRPGPKTPHTHAPIGTHKSGGSKGTVAPHGTPKPTGGGKGNPLH